MSDLIRTLHTDQATFFSLPPRELVERVADRVPRAVYEHERGKLLYGKLRGNANSGRPDLAAVRVCNSRITGIHRLLCSFLQSAHLEVQKIDHWVRGFAYRL